MSLATAPLCKISQTPTAAIVCDVGERLTGILTSKRRLARSPAIEFHARRRLEAVIAQLIEALDKVDKADRNDPPQRTGAGRK